MIRHIARVQRCCLCHQPARHTLVWQTATMPAAAFYPYCDQHRAEFDREPARASRYSIIRWKESA
jgi:hypothetical protein